MASLSKNKWYIWYVREATLGRLELPLYEKNADGTIKIYYGEVFCRMEDCSNSQKKYTATNNLRTHIKSHGNFEPAKENKGGRVSQKIIDEAVGFYKSLFSGIEPQPNGRPSAVEDLTVESETSDESGLPLLPVKKDGSVHVTNMRKKVVSLGNNLPCNSCGKRNDCCKDVNKCDYFVLFECGNIRPTPTNNSTAAESMEREEA